jgi:hypothetical protein
VQANNLILKNNDMMPLPIADCQLLIWFLVFDLWSLILILLLPFDFYMPAFCHLPFDFVTLHLAIIKLVIERV